MASWNERKFEGGASENAAGDPASLLAGQSSCAPMPIWVAALMASHCSASADGAEHTIPWKCEDGRLIYTNMGPSTERIEPFGVRLESGYTIAVSWVPRETSYTVEVFRLLHRCA
jgi:hypothetical protein